MLLSSSFLCLVIERVVYFVTFRLILVVSKYSDIPLHLRPVVCIIVNRNLVLFQCRFVMVVFSLS